jgi:hypothetical protein
MSLFEQQMSPRSSFPSLSTNEFPESTHIRPITKEEMETLGLDIRRQISIDVSYPVIVSNNIKFEHNFIYI